MDLAGPLETYHFLNTSPYEFARDWPRHLHTQIPGLFLVPPRCLDEAPVEQAVQEIIQPLNHSQFRTCTLSLQRLSYGFENTL